MTARAQLPDARHEPETHRSAWRWVLMRWWVVALGIVAGTLAGVLLSLRQQPTYETAAIVVAIETELEPDTFADLGESAFATDAVLQPVVTDLGLDEDWESLAATGRVEARAVSGAVALEVVGRSSDPRMAEALATTAATSFASEAVANGLGTFQLFGTSATVDDSATPSLWVLGGVLGAILGLAIVLFVYSVRRPVLRLHQAEEEYRAGVSISVYMKPTGTDDGVGWQVSPPGTPEVIARRMASVLPPGATVWLLLADRRRAPEPGGRALARRLLEDLTREGLVPAVFRVRGEQIIPLTEVPHPPVQATVAVVVQGAPTAAVRAVDENSRAVAEADAPRLLVFVHPAGRRERRRATGMRVVATGRGLGGRRWGRRGPGGRPEPAGAPHGTRTPSSDWSARMRETTTGERTSDVAPPPRQAVARGDALPGEPEARWSREPVPPPSEPPGP